MDAAALRRVAWLLRDRISVDAWLILNQLDQQFSAHPPTDEFRITAAQNRLNHAIITLSANTAAFVYVIVVSSIEAIGRDQVEAELGKLTLVAWERSGRHLSGWRARQKESIHSSVIC